MRRDRFTEAWDKSYNRGDNFLFYPNEEVIRFASSYIKKRVGVAEYKIIGKKARRALDVGCGIGRHVQYFDEMDIETYGIDISGVAIKTAKEVALKMGKERLANRFLVMSSTAMAFHDSFFDVVISHGTLDSMRFITAKKTMGEIERVVCSGGYVYLDLISGDDSDYAREFDGEIVVKNNHEKNTIQSFFNYKKILNLIDGTRFKLISIKLKKTSDILSGTFYGRWHCILKK